MKTNPLPSWVLPVCFITPFLSLIAVSMREGGATPYAISIVFLCSKVISKLVPAQEKNRRRK